MKKRPKQPEPEEMVIAKLIWDSIYQKKARHALQALTRVLGMLIFDCAKDREQAEETMEYINRCVMAKWERQPYHDLLNDVQGNA